LLGYKREEAGSLHMLGVAYHLLADELKARELYEQSLAVNRSIAPPTISSLSGEAVTLTNIGNLYRGMSYGEIPIDFFSPRTAEDRQKAIEYYKQAIEIWKKVTQLNANAQTLQAFNTQQIGNAYKELGNYSEALKYLNQVLESAKKNNNKGGVINYSISIGNLYVLKGEFQKSFEYFEQALALLRAGGYNVNQVEYLNNIARDYYRAGETQKALDIYNESFALSKAREQQEAASASLFEIARIERDLGNFSNARTRIEEAIQIAESMRAAIKAQEIRTTYFSNVKRYYDFYIDLLMQAHKSLPEKKFDVLALQMSEKARSRTLLDLLTFSRVDLKQGIDPELLVRETQVRERLLERANQQNRLLLGKSSREETEKVKNEVAALTDEYQAIQTEIKDKSPRYAALTQPTTLRTEQIQQLLDSGTILLEYSLGDHKSYLWVVSANSVSVFDLPGRAEIEAQVRRFYEILTARNLNLQVESDAQRRARIKAAEEEYPKVAAQLSRMLFGLAASQIGNERLLIVPDGALNYIPFSALPLLKESEAVSQWQPLGINHEIVTLPSASILALLRNETVNRKPAPKMLAVFADPVFDQNDLRSNVAGNRKNDNSLKANNQTAAVNRRPETFSANRDFDRAVSDLGLVSRESNGLPRLPFSRREANSIFNVSPKNLSLKEIDFEASKSNVFKSNLEQYRILHFATHGLLNSQHPELSGIVLSLVDKNGSEIDGFLRLQDIYNLKLSADLVVLSACQTALGKDIKGEGLISLTRGFMYAGAKSVVASLWKVDDAATAELMTIFYRKMLVENLRPAAALRAAQAEMMKQTRWKSPYYWAAFIIQGDWR
jgi:CHAT domain-containing protein/tetratricopeptide (TPR) repeat protein